MIVRWLVRKADDRLRLAGSLRNAVAKVFPDHWSFMLGEIALYCFVVLVATGVFLTMFFEPSTAERVYRGGYQPLHGSEVSAAYASTVELSFDVDVGLLMRQAHHWAALLLVAAIVCHLCRIFFTAAFRKPRELNWVVGTTLLLLAILNGFAGYSLPDDLLSGTGLRIASAVLLSIPLIGPWAQVLVFGGEFPGDEIIERLYVLHILLVPGLIAALIAVHMAILVRQKHSQFGAPGRTEYNVTGSKMWPTYAFRSLALLAGVSAVVFALGGFVQINPVWVWGPFEPYAVTSPAQPDWYVGWVEGALRLYPPWEFTVFGYLVPAPFVPGVVIPGLTFLALYLVPWLDRLLTKDKARHHLLDRPRNQPGRIAVGVWALVFYGLLLLAGSDDVIARILEIPVLALMRWLRVAVLVLPLLAGVLAYLIAARLRRHGERTLSTLRWGELTSGGVREPAESTGSRRAHGSTSSG